MSPSRFFLRSAALRFGLLAAFTMVSITAPLGFAQTELATVLGRITDQSGAVISGVEVEIRNVGTNSAAIATTNTDGLYSIPSLHPGQYVISVRKAGFRTVSATGLELNVQDNVVRNFALQVGSASESITVTADPGKMNTTDATVSTVVDRNFAENLPMNGRSFQTLIQLTPGVVLTTTNLTDSGQFSVNGQRPTANYWMVDGVGANIGIGANQNGNAGQGLAGSVGSFGVLGGTNSLVSVDAMQEFRIQTSSYAPEFGRQPGAQISIVTRSGTNQVHGSAFDYFRNDILDANDWFANHAGLPKAEERQNDFGGTLSGPILNDRTFFFFSYEGLRLQLPRTELTTVPDVASRQSASPDLQPYLNAFPLPNGPDVGDGSAELNASFSNRSSLDAYSLRIDHKLTNKLNLFGRYNYSPSTLGERGFNGLPFLSSVSDSKIITQTGTAGATWAISPLTVDDLRFNYSAVSASAFSHLDDFGGAVPLSSLPFPSPYTSQNAEFVLGILSLQGDGGGIAAGKLLHLLQRQINIVDSISGQRGSHSLKAGIDYRRLSPVFDPPNYIQNLGFTDVPSATTGSLLYFDLVGSKNATILFQNFGAYAQDTWRVLPRLTLTYGLRWDIDFAPSTLPGVTNFDDPSNLALAPGRPVFATRYSNVAPRLGLAYQLAERGNWQTVLHGGFGAFFDLATPEIGNGVFGFVFPFGAASLTFGGTFPLTAGLDAPPPITAGGGFLAVDPDLNLPYTLQWTASVQQSLGEHQAVTASYVGAAGRRLIQTETVFNPNPNFSSADMLRNSAISDYHSLQLQYQRRLSRGLQVLASYAWSHSIDDASSGSWLNHSNTFVPDLASLNRGPSDFDRRNAFSAGITYEIPAPVFNPFTNALLRGWSLQNIIQINSAAPVDISDGRFSRFGGSAADVRPDLVPGQPLYLAGSQYPGEKALNPGAFTDPPVDANGKPLRQGNVPRNFLRGFGAAQWDCAVHHDFPIHVSLKLQFRAEMFNVLNHPNFGPPNSKFGTGNFGLSTQMLASSLSGQGAAGNGGFSPLYQIGGPRSIQLGLKLFF